MAQFDSFIIFPLIWSTVLVLIAYYKLSLEVLIPHFSGINKKIEKKLLLFNNGFRRANSEFALKTTSTGH